MPREGQGHTDQRQSGRAAHVGSCVDVAEKCLVLETPISRGLLQLHQLPKDEVPLLAARHASEVQHGREVLLTGIRETDSMRGEAK